jgi:hypothetical protein
MKPSVKKLRNCVYSKPIAPRVFFGQETHQTNKLVCDHSEMKINWTVEVCGDCTVYINRNKPPEPEPATPPNKKPRGRKPKVKNELSA